MPTCTLAARGLTLAYDDTGSGLPLVLLHAFPQDRGMWQPQLAALADSARVIAPDLPGFGQSPSAAFTIDGIADVVADFLDALAIPKAVVGGLSMGGYLAMAFARRHANRLAGLILADTRAEPDDDTGRANRDKAIALTREKGVAALFETMLPKVLSERTRDEKPDVVNLAKEIATRQSVEGVTAALAALRDRPDAHPGLAAIAVPTLVLVGEHDAITPPLAAATLAGQIRGSQLVHIPAAGHLSNLENPTAFNAAVKAFMTGLG
jgi:3-oxoadipate enol-lactonase